MSDALGDRMKAYENISRIYLPQRLPVIIRVDGRAFHTFTRGFTRPFDKVLHESMWCTTESLCNQIGGVNLAYTQSDEISLLLTNDDTQETEPWFGNNLQKLVSIAASIATLEFNQAFQQQYDLFSKSLLMDIFDADDQGKTINRETDIQNATAYQNALMKAQFDARAFVLPPSEVVNYFIWRQQDATRNSIQLVAQSLFSHKELMRKNTDQLQEMIFQKGINWNDYPTYYKRGLCYVKKPTKVRTVIDMKDLSKTEIIRNRWVPDYDIPIFTQNRSYIENTFRRENV